MSTEVGHIELRMTPQRQAVLDVLLDSHDHPTASEVYDRVQSSSPGIGAATVYRSLALLVEHGQALELGITQGVARYDANISRHDHLVCEGCGNAVDVDMPIPSRISERLAAATGFTITGYDLQFRGRCPACLVPSAQMTHVHQSEGST